MPSFGSCCNTPAAHRVPEAAPDRRLQAGASDLKRFRAKPCLGIGGPVARTPQSPEGRNWIRGIGLVTRRPADASLVAEGVVRSASPWVGKPLLEQPPIGAGLCLIPSARAIRSGNHPLRWCWDGTRMV